MVLEWPYHYKEKLRIKWEAYSFSTDKSAGYKVAYYFCVETGALKTP